MQIRIHKRAEEDMAVLVDWRILEPLWLRSTFAPVDRDGLVPEYSERWFDKSSLPWKFTLGEIGFKKNESDLWEIQFINGRNRTNLLIKFQRVIPICIEDGMPDDSDIRAALIKPLNEGDIVNIPDLPIGTV